MDFHQLRYFIEVARQEHMGKAARVLAISQSALSHAVSALEEDLGVSLFIREGRRIFLNDSGRFLLEKGERLLSEKRGLEEDLRRRTGEMHGTIRLAAPIAINSHFLGPAWGEIAAQHTHLRAEISSLRSIEIAPRVVAGEIDLGVCFGPQAHPLLGHSLLARRKLVIVIPKKMEWKKSQKKSALAHLLSSLPAALPRGLLGFGHGESHPFFERSKISPNVGLLYDNYDVAIAYIRSKPSWALLPDWIPVQCPDVIRAADSDAFFEPLEITAIWPKTRLRSPIADLVETELRARLKV